ncbi:hypothetical protein PZ897_00315 [Hoeflea sp. YIM 152468]|uniref:hypothetical protein n=1 Tax=Hoeflea sp. YIM 152468 TaxID=3031759 RepID=UPI0023DAE61C|nr:hypothetical protein [Hoeflea sp. YIM 152468]MDF1606609.1 hypothetical protein [Hoeflea sp. YIM 152468]
MSSLALDKLGESPATVLRLFSAVGSAAVFGLLVAPATGAAYWPAAFAWAFGFGFFFVGGTGYRILIAVAARTPSLTTSASWSGATAASALAALMAALVLLARGDDASLVLASYAAAINFAYIPVKFACIQAGCCHAHHGKMPLTGNHDLRRVEITLSALFVAISLYAIWTGAFGRAAVFGLAGHLAVRLFSRSARDRLPGTSSTGRLTGQELPALTLALACSLALALAQIPALPKPAVANPPPGLPDQTAIST